MLLLTNDDTVLFVASLQLKTYCTWSPSGSVEFAEKLSDLFTTPVVLPSIIGFSGGLFGFAVIKANVSVRFV